MASIECFKIPTELNLQTSLTALPQKIPLPSKLTVITLAFPRIVIRACIEEFTSNTMHMEQYQNPRWSVVSTFENVSGEGAIVGLVHLFRCWSWDRLHLISPQFILFVGCDGQGRRIDYIV